MIEVDTLNEYVYVDTYCDEDYTGTDSDRPEFKRLLQDIASKKVTMLIVTDLSRLSRNTSESINYVQVVFVALNIRFISTQLPSLDSYLEPDKVYSLEIPMQSMMNENHAAETSFKVRRTFDNARKNGKFIGAFAGYGWKKDPKDKHKLILDQEAFDVLQMMKCWVLNGDSASMVRKKLNDLGISSPASYKKKKGMRYATGCDRPTYLWSSDTVKKILLRPENIGVLVQGRYKIVSYKIHKQIQMPKDKWIVCKGAIPAVFTNEEQERISAALAKSTRISTKTSKNEVYLFSGFLKCAECGRGVSRKTSKHNVYYNCGTYRRFGPKQCTSHSIGHDELENAVLSTIQKLIEVDVDRNNVLINVKKTSFKLNATNVFEQRIKDNEQELMKMTAYKRSLYEDWKNNDITREEYHSMKTEYEDVACKLRTILANLYKEKESVKKKDNQNSFIVYFMKYKNIMHLDRSILNHFIDYIEIHENKNITIHFKFMDVYKRMID